MTTKVIGEEADYCEWLTYVIGKYRRILLIERHDIDYKRKDEKGHYMSFAFRVPYLDHTVYYSQDAIDQWKKDKRYHERQVIHELCHAITDPLYAVGCERFATGRELESARETATDHIARIVDELTNKGLPL